MENLKAKFNLAIELTSYCNQRCSYCYNAFDHSAGRSLSEEALVHILGRALDEVPIGRVNLTGGEPFSAETLFGALALCSKKQVQTHIVSNGTLITAEKAQRLREYPSLKSVQVTINSFSPKLHDDHVAMTGAWSRAVRGVEWLTENGIETVGCIVLTRRTVSSVGDTLAMMYDLGMRFVSLSRLMAAGISAPNLELLPSRSDIMEALRQADSRPFKDMDVFVSGPLPPCMIDHDAFPSLRWGWCPIGLSHQDFAIGPDGLVRDCLFSTDIIGDPQKQSWGEIIQASHRKGYRKRVPSFCKGCVELPRCLGGCGASATAVTGDANALDPMVLQHIDSDFAAKVNTSRNQFPL